MIIDEVSNEKYLEKHRFNQGRQQVPYDPTPGWMSFSHVDMTPQFHELLFGFEKDAK